MQNVETVRAKAMIDEHNHGEKVERFHLKVIIGMFAWRNGHYWEIANFFCYQHLKEHIKHASNSTFKKLIGHHAW